MFSQLQQLPQDNNSHIIRMFKSVTGMIMREIAATVRWEIDSTTVLHQDDTIETIYARCSQLPKQTRQKSYYNPR